MAIRKNIKYKNYITLKKNIKLYLVQRLLETAVVYTINYKNNIKKVNKNK